MERKIIYKENSEEYKAIKLLEKRTRNYSLDGEDLHYAIILYNLIINLSIENQQLKEEVEAVNKGLRKVQERSIKYKNRCFELNKKIYELEEQLEDITLCRDIASGHRKEVQDRETILLNQQKEFIKWLEDKIQQQETVIAENQEKLYFLIYEDEKEDLKSSSQKAYIRRIILIEILQKYREIIGGK